MYSADREEAIILDYFGEDRGRYLDIGAYDGLTASNTRALMERGWEGVVVEPNPVSFVLLLKQVVGYPVTCVHAALAPVDAIGRCSAWLAGPPMASSTFSERNRKQSQAVRNCEAPTEIFVPLVAVSRFLESFPGPYDFLNIDTEGMDWALLQCMPVREMGVRLLCVEFGQDLARFREWAAENRYSELWKNDCNIILSREAR